MFPYSNYLTPQALQEATTRRKSNPYKGSRPLSIPPCQEFWTQAEQVACFRNAARHLAPGGRCVIELWIAGIRRFPPGQAAVPFHVGQHHVGFDTYDMTTQQGTSHHYRRQPDGTVTYGASNFRYIWPAECDLMAQLAGMSLERRIADWHGNPFTNDSESHVSVWRKPS